MNIDVNQTKQKIKEHLERHKVLYSCATTGVMFAGITCLIMRSNIAQGGMSRANAQGGLSNTASLIFKNKQIINTITVLERDGRGHPGYPVRNLETKHIEPSQFAMANYFGIPEGLLSGHLNGKFPDVDGLHFERVSFPQEAP